ncbi:group II intron maturase-specific domain-containing protein [Thiorhodococcus minor]|uniref:group II intron maturase-specific domain-containing protein n=1 Tax=Thiorhodococcus minor TaxID=57489 RepID=UPI001ADA0441|nr:group II intron maturase-specific domain-containing protein [Thiorhodococcus minor]
MELAEEKTRIVHIDQGVDFLGFNVRKYQGKLLIEPAASSIAAVKERVRGIIRTGKGLPQGVLIRRLNPVIRGWGNDYRHVVSKDIFNDIDHAIWRMSALADAEVAQPLCPCRRLEAGTLAAADYEAPMRRHPPSDSARAECA